MSPEYFGTLKIPLVAGRDFDDRDVKGAPQVAIVNQAWARKYAGTANPVGMRFHVEPSVDASAVVSAGTGTISSCSPAPAMTRTRGRTVACELGSLRLFPGAR